MISTVLANLPNFEVSHFQKVCFQRLYMQLTLEQYRFLHESIYMQIFFNKYTGISPYLQVSHLCIQLQIINSIFYSWLGISRCEGQLYALFYTILCKGIEHAQVLEFVGDPRINSLWIMRDDHSWVFGKLKVIHKFLTVLGLVPLITALFKGQL